MTYLIKILFIIFIPLNGLANDNQSNKTLFKLNNKIFTNIDYERRIKYIEISNNINYSDLNKQSKKEIYEDFLNVVIFYEYYLKNKIRDEKIDNNIEQIFKQNFAKHKKSVFEVFGKT